MSEPPTPKKPITWPEVPCDGESMSRMTREMFDKRGGLYPVVQENREDRWRTLVLAYEANPDFYNAWRWINEHPLFYRFNREIHERGLMENRAVVDGGMGGIEIIPVMVNPADDTHSQDPRLNTKLAFWVEVFPRAWEIEPAKSLHAYEQDTGGDTYEEAIVNVAAGIYEYYGNDRARLDEEWKQ
jgi:hypothetical protein